MGQVLLARQPVNVNVRHVFVAANQTKGEKFDMENSVVVNADTDSHGAKKENIFIALDGNGQYLGSLLIYPYFDHDLEPEHPHNLQLHLHAGRGKDLSESVKDPLLEHALRRATEIKRDAEQTKTRVYAWFLKHQQKEIAYFLQPGFTHDEGMHILERYDSAALPQAEAPEEVTIQAWKHGNRCGTASIH